MDKLKISIIVNAILAIGLITMTILYFNTRKIAEENRDAYVNAAKQIQMLVSQDASEN